MNDVGERHLRGDRRRAAGSQLRMADNGRPVQPRQLSSVHESDIQLPAQQRDADRVRHHWRSVLHDAGSDVSGFLHREVFLRRLLLGLDPLHRSAAARRPRRRLLPASARRSTSNSAPTAGSTTSRGSGQRRKIVPSGTGLPQITQQPANRSVAAGATATFTVTASGTAPLSYQWQKNGVDIPTATTALYTTPPTVLADNGSTYRCRVTNSAGSTTSNAATLTVLNNLAPTARYRRQRVGSKYSAGTTLSFSGSGPIRRTALCTGRSSLAHRLPPRHAHAPGHAETSGIAGGTFAIPNSGEVSANVWYRVYLTATDSAGLSTTSFVDVTPNTATITLSTCRPGSR